MLGNGPERGLGIDDAAAACLMRSASGSGAERGVTGAIGSTAAAAPSRSGAISNMAGLLRPECMSRKASQSSAGTSLGCSARATQSMMPRLTANWSLSSCAMP
jgi:hypothetical protein